MNIPCFYETEQVLVYGMRLLEAPRYYSCWLKIIKAINKHTRRLFSKGAPRFQGPVGPTRWGGGEISRACGAHTGEPRDFKALWGPHRGGPIFQWPVGPTHILIRHRCLHSCFYYQFVIRSPPTICMLDRAQSDHSSRLLPTLALQCTLHCALHSALHWALHCAIQ